MGVTYNQGQILGRGDLDIFLTNTAGNPTNAASITFAIYWVDAGGVEVLIGDAARAPVNPSIGEYYAAIMIPPGAAPGAYRIRWTFRERSNYPEQQVVQEFGVVGEAVQTGGSYGVDGSLTAPVSGCVAQLISDLRVLTRDNCIAGEEILLVRTHGGTFQVTIADLYERVSSSGVDGTLEIQSISPQGEVVWKPVTHVLRHETPDVDIYRCETSYGCFITTSNHRVFTSPTEKTEMEDLVKGDALQAIVDNTSTKLPLLSKTQVESRKYMYDLTVADWHNFVLHTSKVVVSNSPDRNYHFRPPNGEGTINCYNQVFGYIWEDAEFEAYLRIALDKWNMQAPATPEMCDIETLCRRNPPWKAALLWGALVNAAQALAYNWVSEEFSIQGNSCIRVYTPDGHVHHLTIEELYHECQQDPARINHTLVEAVDPITGSVHMAPISDVLQHHTGHKRAFEVTFSNHAAVITTEDHSFFVSQGDGIIPVETKALRVGDMVVSVENGVKSHLTVEQIQETEPLAVSYDISVPGFENFVLENGVLVHNSYSIGGISLDIDKSSKYMDLKRNAEEQWDKLVEAKYKTTHYIKGIVQPRYGMGVRSSFGPYSGRGVLSPRNFL